MIEQLDYILFLYGFGFIGLAVVCFLADKKKKSLPWVCLGFFGLFRGLNEWLEMLDLSVGHSLTFTDVRICIMALSCICLIEFGRLGTKSITGKGPGRWVTLSLFVVACTGWFYGWVGLDVFFRHFLGIVGGLWSAFALILASRQSDNIGKRRILFVLGTLLAAYAVTTILAAPKTSFLPAALPNQDSFQQIFGFPIQLLRGTIALSTAMCVWLVLGSHKTKQTFRTIFVCSLMVILAGGWFFTNQSGISEQREWMRSLHSTCGLLASYIDPKVAEELGSVTDTNDPRNQLMRKSFMAMIKTNPEYSWIYLMSKKDDKIIFTADSEPPSSKNYTTIGTVYSDAPTELRALFRGESQDTTAKYKDRWGEWISAFVPVRDDSTGKLVAVLGIDFLNSKVQDAVYVQRLHSIVITILVVVLALLLFFFLERREVFIESIAKAKDALLEKEEHLSCTLHSIGDAVIATDCDRYITRINKIAELLTGWTAADAIGRPISEVFHIVNSQTREPAFNPITQVLATGENAELANGTIIISKDGVERQIADSCSPVCNNQGHTIGVILIFRDVTEEHKIKIELQERVKELTCLYSVAKIIEQEDNFETILQRVVEIIPQGWFYPEIVCVCITYEGQQYKTANFLETKWQLSTEISVNGRLTGAIHLYYLEERPLKDKGQFLNEERQLINAIAERLSRVIQRKEIEEVLQNEKNNLAAIFASSPIGMLLLDEDTIIVDANSVAADMVSRNLDKILNQRVGGGLGCVHSLENEKGCGFASVCPDCSLRQGITQVLKTGTSIRGAEIQATLIINGQEQSPWLRVSAEPVIVNGRKHVIIAIDNITERKQIELTLASAKVETERLNQQLEEALVNSNQYIMAIEVAKERIEEDAVKLADQATHDALTGLPNRIMFNDTLTSIVSSKRKAGLRVAVMFIDLDKFKLVNDTLGHNIGDKLLVKVSKRLKSCLRADDDLLCRMGGDEFTIILKSAVDVDIIKIVAGRILAEMGKLFTISGHDINIGASIGVSIYPQDGTVAESIVRMADTAMYKAKELGRNNCQFFSIDMDAANLERMQIERELRAALINNEFEVYYQPRVDPLSGEVFGAEALVRWNNPPRGHLVPGNFIGIAKECGIITQLENIVIKSVCSQLKGWIDAGGEPIVVSINLSDRMMRQSGFKDGIESNLKEYNIPASSIAIEISGASLMEASEEIINSIRRLRQEGMTVILDDFSKSPIPLAALRQLPIDGVQIDSALICGLTDNDWSNTSIAASITATAHNMGLEVIAIGVETQEQMNLVNSLMCDLVQGHLISHPLDWNAFIEFVAHKKLRYTRDNTDAAA